MTNKKNTHLKISSPKEFAAGIPAVLSAYKNTSTKVGVLDGSSLLFKLNQFKGFDCPGCAWPDPLGKRATFEFCENGAKAIADEATKLRITASFFNTHSISSLKTQSDKWLNDQGRLTEPMFKDSDSDYYRPISWSSAFAMIAKKLNGLTDPNQASFYTSGRTSNEAAFLYQLFVRMYGTNNLPDCSNMCHESSGVGLSETIGIGKGTVSLEDLDTADCIFVFGQNPGSNHPRMLGHLQTAKRNGASIISVNPLDETGLKRFKNPQEISGIIGTGTDLRDLHLPIKINGDLAFVKGMCRLMIEREQHSGNVLDHEFITLYCDNFEEFKADILTTPWSVIELESGLTKELIEKATNYACASKRTICCWAMGLTQHKNAVANIQIITNFLMLRGNLGRKGAGVCPVRGHSNVQGDRTMGIWEKAPAHFLDALEKEFSFTVPRKDGADTLDTIHGMLSNDIKIFFALGGNFFRAAPDHQATEKALDNTELSVQVSTKLNKSHLYTGKQALILPTLGRTELDEQATGVQFVTVENSMGVIQTSNGRIPPASKHLKSEVEIVCQLAINTLADKTTPWQAFISDYSIIRDRIARVIPEFVDYNARLGVKGEFVLANAVRDERKFNTSSGKANFVVNEIQPIVLPTNALLMMTIRSHDQFNTTIYTDNDRYRGVHGSRELIFMNKEDITALALKEGMKVDIRTANSYELREVKRFTIVEYSIPKGCVATYYPETNDLIDLDNAALKSNTPAYKSIPVFVNASR